MVKHISRFDQVAADIVARIPASFEKPLIWLGRVSTPLLWASYLVILHYMFISNGALSGDVLIVLMVLPLASLLKLFFRRKRPPTIYAESMRIKSYSFPSSHAYSATLAGGYLAVVMHEKSWVIPAAAMALLVITIALSRIRIGAHYPSDVLAGTLLGTVVLWVIVSS